jgi:adenylosuccinate lyase
MRARGIADAYEQLKDLTRGQAITETTLRDFIDRQPLPEADRRRLRSMKPRDYIGLATELTQRLKNGVGEPPNVT